MDPRNPAAFKPAYQVVAKLPTRAWKGEKGTVVEGWVVRIKNRCMMVYSAAAAATAATAAAAAVASLLLQGVHGISFDGSVRRCGDITGDCEDKTGDWLGVDAVLCEGSYDCNRAVIPVDAYCGVTYSCGGATIEGNAHCIGSNACGVEDQPNSSPAYAAQIKGDVYCYSEDSCSRLSDQSVQGCCHALNPDFCPTNVGLCQVVDLEPLQRTQLEESYLCGSESPLDCWYTQVNSSIICASQGLCIETLAKGLSQLICRGDYSCNFPFLNRFALENQGVLRLKIGCETDKSCIDLEYDIRAILEREREREREREKNLKTHWPVLFCRRGGLWMIFGL